MIPFWLIWAFAGRKATREIWPAIGVTGVSFAVPQFLVSNYIGPELVDVIAAVCSICGLLLQLRVWQPKTIWTSVTLNGHRQADGAAGSERKFITHPRSEVIQAWMPWLILTVFVFVWGLPASKFLLNSVFAPAFPIAGLDRAVERMPPAVLVPTQESAVYTFAVLSVTGTGILLAAIIGGWLAGYRSSKLAVTYAQTVWCVKSSLTTIALMLALGTLTRYSGMITSMETVPPLSDQSYQRRSTASEAAP